MSELTNTKQWEEEHVVDYINRWRALCLECKDRISETSAVEMCINGMKWELLYILKGIKPRSFQELATRAHNMEITVQSRRNGHIPSKALTQAEHDEIDKTSRSRLEEAMVVSTNNNSIRNATSRDFKHDKFTLKEMLEDLLEKGIIQLPEAKRPGEVHKTDNPKYCRYHRMVSHNIKDCITLKELIMKLVSDGRILLDNDETVDVNHTTTTTIDDPTQKPFERSRRTIKFGSLPPRELWSSKPLISPKSHGVQNINEEADDVEGWTTVTRKKAIEKGRLQSKAVHRQSKHWGKKMSKHVIEKLKSKRVVKPHAPSDDHPRHDPRPLATLKDFFPEGYFAKVNPSSVTTCRDGEDSEALENEACIIKRSRRQTLQKVVEAPKGEAHPFSKTVCIRNITSAVGLNEIMT